MQVKNVNRFKIKNMLNLTKTILLLLTITVSIVVQAQPFTLDKNVKPTELLLIPYKNVKDSIWNGKINVTTVKQTVDTMYFFVKGLSIYQPIYIGVDNNNKTQKCKIFLSKDNWKNPDKSGELVNGFWQQKFKTEGSFGIMVVANKPVQTYNITVWVGKELINRKLPSPFKTKTKDTPKPTKTKTSKN